MTKLQWDLLGQRFYETGVDRGVLYLPEGLAVPWNGLTSVDENAESAPEPSYFDGVKYVDHALAEDYSASVKAITYPKELDRLMGMVELDDGYFVDDQPYLPFHFSYRVRVGNDVAGDELGYKIHLVFNVVVQEDDKGYSSRSRETVLTDFGWTLSATPEPISGFKPTAHIVIDTRTINRYLLPDLEAKLYGDETTDPDIGSLAEFTDWAINYEIISIVDNGDGTWTATGPDELVYMTDATSFRIEEANSEVISWDTYRVSSSNPT